MSNTKSKLTHTFPNITMPHNKWPMTLGSILSPGPSWHTTTQYDRYFPKKVFIAILSTFSESPMSQWPEWCKLTHCRIINASNTKDLRFKLTPYFPQNLFCARIFFAPFFHQNERKWRPKRPQGKEMKVQEAKMEGNESPKGQNERKWRLGRQK